jgi:hypothetical protein
MFDSPRQRRLPLSGGGFGLAGWASSLHGKNSDAFQVTDVIRQLGSSHFSKQGTRQGGGKPKETGFKIRLMVFHQGEGKAFAGAILANQLHFNQATCSHRDFLTRISHVSALG